MIATSSVYRPAGNLILASASPRRKELLQAAGIPFEVLPASVPERQKEGETAAAFVLRMAAAKAERARVVAPQPCLAPVLGADTAVVLGTQTLGKPAAAEEARRMLRLLSGQQHQVLTGLCLIYPSERRPSRQRTPVQDLRLASTTVKFTALTETEIEHYVATGEPLDKAGAYAIQGQASKYVEWIHGCYFNVVGLPVSLLHQMLKKMEFVLRKEEIRNVIGKE